jgi:anthranilate phosphoribosyltransferase
MSVRSRDRARGARRGAAARADRIGLRGDRGGRGAPAAIAALLAALRTKGETVGEIVGAARALRAVALSAPCLDPRTVDTCGTGGDGAHTFNISTTAAFAVAARGRARGQARQPRCVEQVGQHRRARGARRRGRARRRRVEPRAREGRDRAVLRADRASAMRHVAPVRQALGIRTLMNCMGPLLNPLGVRRQVIGVYDRALVPTLAHALAQLGSERVLVVHGSDGLDELTITGPTHAALLERGSVRELVIDPKPLGVRARARRRAARRRRGRESPRSRSRCSTARAGPRRDVVLLNAAAALWVADAAKDLAEGLALARAGLDSGDARARSSRRSSRRRSPKGTRRDRARPDPRPQARRARRRARARGAREARASRRGDDRAAARFARCGRDRARAARDRRGEAALARRAARSARTSIRSRARRPTPRVGRRRSRC